MKINSKYYPIISHNVSKPKSGSLKTSNSSQVNTDKIEITDSSRKSLGLNEINDLMVKRLENFESPDNIRHLKDLIDRDAYEFDAGNIAEEMIQWVEITKGEEK